MNQNEEGPPEDPSPRLYAKPQSAKKARNIYDVHTIYSCRASTPVNFRLETYKKSGGRLEKMAKLGGMHTNYIPANFFEYDEEHEVFVHRVMGFKVRNV